MSALKTAIESYLQDLAAECDDVLADLNLGTIDIDGDNQVEAENALALMMKTFDAVKALKRPRAPQNFEHDDATQPVWSRLVSAA